MKLVKPITHLTPTDPHPANPTTPTTLTIPITPATNPPTPAPPPTRGHTSDVALFWAKFLLIFQLSNLHKNGSHLFMSHFFEQNFCFLLYSCKGYVCGQETHKTPKHINTSNFLKLIKLLKLLKLLANYSQCKLSRKYIFLSDLIIPSFPSLYSMSTQISLHN